MWILYIFLASVCHSAYKAILRDQAGEKPLSRLTTVPVLKVFSAIPKITYIASALFLAFAMASYQQPFIEWIVLSLSVKSRISITDVCLAFALSYIIDIGCNGLLWYKKR